MRYFQLKQDLKDLYAFIQENGIDGCEDTLDSVLEDLQDKVKFYFEVRQSAIEKIDFYKKIIEKYTELIHKEKRSLEYAESRLLDVNETFGEIEIKDDNDYPLFTVKSRISESLVVKDISLLDEKYLRSKVIVEPDKNLIKKAIKENELQETENLYIEKKKNLYLK